MLVKIGDTIYNSTQVPILLILDQEEKELIGNMSEDNHKFCSFPDDVKADDIIDFMKTDINI